MSDTTSSDRELLELAARAAGHKIHHWSTILPGPMLVDPETDDCGGYWNPLEEDGDALRLAVRLSMTVQVDVESKSVAAVWYAGKLDEEPFTDHASAEAATRRAIVRCAALAEPDLRDMRNRRHLGIAAPGAVSRGDAK